MSESSQSVLPKRGGDPHLGISGPPGRSQVHMSVCMYVCVC